MIYLDVQVKLHGVPVEARSVEVNDVVRLGGGPGAEVAFPGADLRIVRVGDHLAVRGRTLEVGDELCIGLGPVEVHMTAYSPTRLRQGRWLRFHGLEWAPDLRVLLATVAMALVATSYEVATVVVDRNPMATVVVATWVQGQDPAPLVRNAELSTSKPQPRTELVLPEPVRTREWPTATYLPVLDGHTGAERPAPRAHDPTRPARSE